MRDFAEPLCLEILDEALVRINPSLPRAAIDEAIARIRKHRKRFARPQKRPVHRHAPERRGGQLLRRQRTACRAGAAGGLRPPDAQPVHGREPVDGRGAVGAQGRHRGVRQRVAAGGRRAEIPLARGDRRLGGLRPVAQLHAGDSLALCLQRLLRDERPGDHQGRDHHGRRGPIHGVEDRGRQAGGRALRQFRRPLPRDVREESLHRAARRLHLLRGEGRASRSRY